MEQNKRKFLEAEDEIDAKKSKGLRLKIRYKESEVKEEKRIDPSKSFEEPKFMVVPVGRVSMTRTLLTGSSTG